MGKVKRGKKANKDPADLLHVSFAHRQSYMKPLRKLLACGAGASVTDPAAYLNVTFQIQRAA